MNPTNPQPTEEQRRVIEEELKKEHALTFTKGELIVIFNILTRVQFNYGDFKAVDPIIKKIEPIVAVASNIPPTNNVDMVLGTEKPNN